MKILYFHQYFSTPNGSGGNRSYFFAKELVNAGHSVTIVCLNDVRSNTDLISPFKNGKRVGFIDGIKIIEFDLKYSNYKNLFERSLIFLKYSFQSTLIAFNTEVDLIFATSTPLTAGIPGILARWIKGTRFVFEVRDLWPQLPAATGVIKNRFILFLLSCLEIISYHSADVCIGLAPGICKGIASKGINKLNIKNIPNVSDLELFKPIKKGLKKRPDLILKKGEALSKDDFVAAFTGAHGLCNGLESLLDVALELKKLNRKDIKLVFIGEGSHKKDLQKRAKQEELNNCLFINSIPKIKLAKILSNSVHVGLMVLRDIPAFYEGTSPNKFFDYIAAGIPVITNYPGWISELIINYKMGYSIKPNNPVDFAKALIYLADNKLDLREKGFNARNLAENNFSKNKLASEWRNVLEDVVNYRK